MGELERQQSRKKALENKAKRLRTAYKKAADVETVMEKGASKANKFLSDAKWRGSTADEFESLTDQLSRQIKANDKEINSIRDQWNRERGTAENEAAACDGIIKELGYEVKNFVQTNVENAFN